MGSLAAAEDEEESGVFFTSYIFVGIEEVGAQVEQPFEITPMTRLCNVVMFNLEESFAPPIVHHEDEKGMQKGPWKGL